MLSGVHIPLSAFAGVDLTHIRAVELRTDRTEAGRVHLADLAFTAEGTAEAAGPALPAGNPALVPCRRRRAGERYACAVAQVVWGRDLDPEEIATALPLVATAAGRRAYATWLAATPETLALRLQRYLQPLTQASVDASGLVEQLSPAGRRSWEAAQAELASDLRWSYPSYETPAQITDALFETYLGAPADAAGRSYWIGRIQSGRSPAELARALRRTTAHRQFLVTDWYQELLGRSPDSASLDYWTGRLAADGSEKILVVTLMNSERFRQLALAST
ncbi:MAG TPA: DUF4214 domain-containing protein [Iamia sp.]|nr:DUF4214 domain-containing protein [Iamia sp.]